MKYLVYHLGTNNNTYGWVRLTEGGLASTIEVKTHYIVNGVAWVDVLEGDNVTIGYRESSWNNEDITLAAETQLGISGGSYMGRTKIGNSYYGVYANGGSDFTFFRVYLDPIDKYLYSYDGETTVGEVLRDLGIMTDCLIWIDPNGQFHFKSSSGISEIPAIPKDQVKSLKVESLGRRNEKLELPKAFTMADSVRTELINHYDLITRGFFNRSIIVIEEEALRGYTLPLRSITIGETNYGIVKRGRVS